MHSYLMGAAASAALMVTLSAAAGDPAAALEFLGRYQTGVFDEGAAEIAAYDPATMRVFVINGFTGAIDVLDIADPTNPTLVMSISVAPWGDQANSVDVHDGVIAAAVQAVVKTNPGRAVFFDAAGNHLADVEVGALPDMLTFTPDGSKVVVCNEAEPSDDYAIDPEGSVSIIDLSGGVLGLTQAEVATAGFTAFNGGAPAGVRITGPGATVAEDMEPEYAAVSKDSRTAWVTCQENNAIAIVDLTSATVSAIVPLGFKEHASGTPSATFHPLNNLPVLGVTAGGQEIKLGGFSGLWFDGVVGGHWRFLTIPDRGPNAEPLNVDADPLNERPFPLPDYQARVVELDLDPVTGVLTIVNQTMLFQQNGTTPISGLPNILCSSNGMAYFDEEPCDVFGQPLPLDPYGADMEGIVRADDSTLWMCDEYRPALYHFAANGTLLARYVPEGSNCGADDVGVEAFPAVYAQRRINRGFEGLAYWNGLIYAFIQSPIDNPDVANDNSSKNSVHGRVLVFNPATESTVAEYLYVFEGGASDKIGDAVAVGPGKFLVIERDSSTGPASLKKVFELSLAGATDLSTLDPGIVGPGGTLELMTPAQLALNGIVPVSKKVYCDLSEAGYQFTDKPEGLTIIHPGMIAVINDNDFQLAGGLNTATGQLTFLANPQPVVLSLISFNGNGLDTSRDDGGIRIKGWPVRGLFMPDAIDSFEADGSTWLITANEGDAREYDTFTDTRTVNSVTLDPRVFRMASSLKTNPQLGRLNIVNTSGDLDGDGDLDEIHSYGARSVTIWDTDGALVWDSGDALEQLTAQLLPTRFNSNSTDNNTFDRRSPSKGPEPEGVAVGSFGDLRLAFVALERIGGIAILNVTDPHHPSVVGYRTDRDFSGDPSNDTAGDLGPEGLHIVDAADSPTGEPLLIVASEVSGSTTIYEINVNAALCLLPEDLTNDCAVNYADLMLLLSEWGPCGGTCKSDIDGDGDVGVSDLMLLLAAWTD